MHGVEAKLAALDMASGARVVACMQTAAEMYGFDTEPDDRLHIVDPGTRMRPSPELMVHQRVGAPLKTIRGRLATAPAWTAVEIARNLRRPRALAVLDADGGLPMPELQYEIRDLRGDLWRVDFAWPDSNVVAEYDSVEWHANTEGWKRDRMKAARLQACGWWLSVPIIVDDVRKHPS